MIVICNVTVKLVMCQFYFIYLCFCVQWNYSLTHLNVIVVLVLKFSHLKSPSGSFEIDYLVERY